MDAQAHADQERMGTVVNWTLTLTGLFMLGIAIVMIADNYRKGL